jgi:amino acid adenylation domain-containing protein
VPLDPGYPPQRLASVLEDARVSAVLTQRSLTDLVRELGPWVCEEGRIVCVDDISENALPLEGWDGSALASKNLAYVIYTSGSTGKPKGVQIEHRSVVNFLESMRRQPGLGEEDVLVAVTTLSFDIAGLELLLPLTTGARVVLASRETASDGQALVRLLEQSHATVMQATPATWRLLIEAGWRGHPKFKILCGGEAWNQELAEQLLARCGSLWNMYGPTETTIWSAASRVSGGGAVCIAGPIANTQFYIVDKFLQPVPIGIAGELCIGGDGVARGFLNRPELTSEKFTANPFGGGGGGRLYRTGDLARYRADGAIEFLGRMDQQVKLRGFRIELGEIEAAMGQHPQSRQVVVSVREDAPGDPVLVAYVAANSDQAPSPAEWRDWLRPKLPEYMVPSFYVTLETLPLTPNGKVNRKALPEPERARPVHRNGFAAPRTALEKKLAVSWAEVLGAGSVGIDDNFFELGGHSLLGARLISRIRQALQIELPLRSLFEFPTIAGLAECIENIRWISRAVTGSAVPGDQEEGEV